MRILFDNGTTATIASGNEVIVVATVPTVPQDGTIEVPQTSQKKSIKILGFNQSQDDDGVEAGQEQKGASVCASLKKNGEPCGRSTKLGETYCFFHTSTCKALTSKGLKCNNGCMEGTDACGYHAATCPGTTKSGQPCQLAAEFCRYHRLQTKDDGEGPSYSSSSSSSSKSKSEMKIQCLGLTKKGQRCRLKVPDDQEFCHFHSS